MRSALLKKLTVDKDRREFVEDKVPASRPKFMWFLYRKHSQDFMKANFLFILLVMPLFVCITFLPGIFKNLAIADTTYNFLGNIGVGFPGTVDSLAGLKLAIYDQYIWLMLCIAGAILILSLGASGMFYVCRNIAWRTNTKVRAFRDFFKGIRLYFFRYLFLFAIIAAVFFGTSMLYLWHMGLMALGIASAGSWIAVIAVSIVDLYLLAVVMIMLPMLCAYKFNIFTAIKNSMILAVILFPLNIIILALFAAPFLLGLMSSFVSLLIWMVFIMFGGTFYCFAITSFGQYAFDITINSMYAQGLKNTQNRKKKKSTGAKSNSTKEKTQKNKKFTVESAERTNDSISKKNVILMGEEDGGEKKFDITVINGDAPEAKTEEKEAVTKVVNKSQYGKYKTKKVKK